MSTKVDILPTADFVGTVTTVTVSPAAEVIEQMSPIGDIETKELTQVNSLIDKAKHLAAEVFESAKLFGQPNNLIEKVSLNRQV